MRQVFRLMNMPDRVIAFDELPERFLEGFELCRADGFPRHWKEWMGKIKKVTKVPPEKDPFTGSIRRFDPILEEDCFFYLVDWTLNPVVEKWREICDFVKRTVDKDVRLMEKIEDMALPLAANKTDGVTLEPEAVVVIPIPLEFQEKKAKLAVPGEIQKEPENVPLGTITKTARKVKLKCDECDKELKNEKGLQFHKNRMHKAVAA